MEFKCFDEDFNGIRCKEQCEACTEARIMRETEKKHEHLNSPFYKRSENFRAEVKRGQILKGAEKYHEPFNPRSWTAEELLVHAMQENVDQEHYQYGLYEKLVELQSENEQLKAEIKVLRGGQVDPSGK
jgi:hypothetical protein